MLSRVTIFIIFFPDLILSCVLMKHTLNNVNEKIYGFIFFLPTTMFHYNVNT